MAGKIIADIIEAPAGRISLNVANVTVASINASGIFSSTGNLIIASTGNIGINAIADGAVTTAKIEDGAVTDAKLTLEANASNIKTALNASGDAPIYACRAWVNFNGTGTVAIRASGNVSSITDSGTGNYTVNFATAMPDADYSSLATTTGASEGSQQRTAVVKGTPGGGASLKTTTALAIQTGATSSNALVDMAEINVSIFR
jgi:hypothetical protein